ncbi:MAG: hypothetical protein JNM57_00925 [Cyclobacteriaceae bacterium]|nr:hypothetical protein [Cyclobacteriaceae bacterium]
MNLTSTVKQYADQIGGQFTDYDHTKSIVVVPIDSYRFQTILALTQKSPVSGREQAVFSSKVCEFSSSLDLKSLLEQSANFDFSKFVLEDGYLKVEASCLVSSATEDQVKEMIQEVAQLADHYELKLTGKDIH